MSEERESRMSAVTKKNHEENQKKRSQERLNVLDSANEEDRKIISSGNGTVDYTTGKIVRT